MEVRPHKTDAGEAACRERFPFFVWPKEKPHAAKADVGLEGSMSCVDRREAIVGVTAKWPSWITPRARPSEGHAPYPSTKCLAKHTDQPFAWTLFTSLTSSSEYSVRATDEAGL